MCQEHPAVQGVFRNDTSFFSYAPCLFWGHRKKFMCLSSLEKTEKRDMNKKFVEGDFGVRKGVPNSGTKKRSIKH